MTWQAKATLNALVTFVAAIPGLQSVRKGEPTSLPTTVAAFVSIGAMPYNDRTTTGNVRRDGEYWVTFGYRVQGAAETAEETLADIIDAFQTRFLDERKSGKLGGTVESMDIDMSPAGAAEYRPLSGQEYRLYPVIIRVVQHHTVT